MSANSRYLVFLISFCFSVPIYNQHNSWLVRSDSEVVLKSLLHKSSSLDAVGIVSRNLNIYQFDFNRSLERHQVESLIDVKLDNLEIFPNLNLDYRNTEPNDFFYPNQYSLDLIEVEKAWQQTTGGLDIEGNEVVIAVLDDGFDLLHEDLVDNYWINRNEIPDDGIDNDGNGYVDDKMGVNIQTGTNIHAGVKHGTQVSGIIGAKGNNAIGIAGLNWDARLLLISGVSNIGEVIKSMEYLYDLKKAYIDSNGELGANIVVNNFSGGLKRLFPSDFPSWCEAYDLLGSVGILSVGAVANENFDVEVEGDLPTLCESDFLITVTNTNRNDLKVINSAFGSQSVDLGAPGENIISASIGNDYENISGTSASAPHVAGAVGLLASLPCPALSELIFENPQQYAIVIKSAILNGTDSISGLEFSVSKGRLNVFNAMLEMRNFCGTPQEGELNLEILPNYINETAPPSYIRINYQSELVEPHELSIYDVRGQLWYTERFSPPLFENGLIIIDYAMLRLSSGTYIFQLSNSNQSVSQKFIVVR